MRLALIIEYEGTDYSGFQFQENASTIQGELEKSINCLTFWLKICLSFDQNPRVLYMNF